MATKYNKNTMKKFFIALYIISVGWFLTACKPRHANSSLRDSGPFTKIYDATFDDVILITKASDTDLVLQEKILSQLAYSLGYLKSLQSAANIARAQVQIKGKTPDKNGDQEVRYQAKVTIAFAKKNSVGNKMHFIFPSRVDSLTSEGGFAYTNEEFNREFKHGCVWKEDPLLKNGSGDDLDDQVFWHYFDPSNESCSLRDLFAKTETPQKLDLGKGHGGYLAVANLSPNNQIKGEKIPNYDAIWKDGKLKVLSYHFPQEALNASDKALDQVVATLSAFKDAFGQPTYTPENGAPALDHKKRLNDQVEALRAFQAVYKSAKGPIEIHFRLGQNPETLASETSIRQEFATAAPDTDLYVYAGHSGYGKNIKNFLALLKPEANQYSLFWLHGCNTYMYTTTALQKAYGDANPGRNASDFYDAMVTETYGQSLAVRDEFMIILQAIEFGHESFNDFLGRFKESDYPVVIGEETNQDKDPKAPQRPEPEDDPNQP